MKHFHESLASEVAFGQVTANKQPPKERWKPTNQPNKQTANPMLTLCFLIQLRTGSSQNHILISHVSVLSLISVHLQIYYIYVGIEWNLMIKDDCKTTSIIMSVILHTVPERL